MFLLDFCLIIDVVNFSKMLSPAALWATLNFFQVKAILAVCEKIALLFEIALVGKVAQWKPKVIGDGEKEKERVHVCDGDSVQTCVC